MDLKYTLEDFNGEIREAYLRLLPHQEQAVTAGKLDWKFARNPAGKGKIAVCRDGKKIVGLNAFMAGNFGGAGSLRAFQSMDTIVASEARGKGVFNRLINRFYDDAPGDTLYGFPNLSSSPGFFGKLGWTSLGPAPMLVKPLRAGIFLKRLHPKMPDFPLPAFLPAMPDIEQIDHFPASVGPVWDGFAKTNKIRIALRRDATFMNWRLLDHPVADYTGWKVGDEAFAASCIEEKHGGRIGYVMEAFGSQQGVADLVNGMSLHMQRARADAIFAWVLPHSSNYKAFRAAGFIPLPDRIRPIKLNFGAKALKPDSPPIGPVTDWYVSYLDSDTV